MSTPRREFLQTGLTLSALLVGAVQSKLVSATTSASEIFSFANLAQPQLVFTGYPTEQGFTDMIGEIFWVDMGAAETMLRLKLVNVVNQGINTFIVVFKTKDKRKLSQDTYRMDHATAGPIPMFMGHNPVTEKKYHEKFVKNGRQKTARVYYYEAVFNFAAS